MPEIQVGIVALAGLCVALTGIWTFCEKVMKPFKEFERRLSAAERRAEENHGKLVHDHTSLKEQEKVNKLVLQSCSILMKHCADTNHTGELKAHAEKVDSFIYDKGGQI